MRYSAKSFKSSVREVEKFCFVPNFYASFNEQKVLFHFFLLWYNLISHFMYDDDDDLTASGTSKFRCLFYVLAFILLYSVSTWECYSFYALECSAI